ncbi:MAG TPA: hypothetical protein VMU87_14715 [Stellaceae bacterium]|nr:hypothetical protein [Stellaceae bacterium]
MNDRYVGLARGRARGWRFSGAVTVACLMVGCTGVAKAAPPKNADPALAPWFNGLRQPGTGASCCSTADCRISQYRTEADGYEVLIDGQWVRVPPEAVLDHTSNPTGRAVVCYLPDHQILCFVRPAET